MRTDIFQKQVIEVLADGGVDVLCGVHWKAGPLTPLQELAQRWDVARESGSARHGGGEEANFCD